MRHGFLNRIRDSQKSPNISFFRWTLHMPRDCNEGPPFLTSGTHPSDSQQPNSEASPPALPISAHLPHFYTNVEGTSASYSGMHGITGQKVWKSFFTRSFLSALVPARSLPTAQQDDPVIAIDWLEAPSRQCRYCYKLYGLVFGEDFCQALPLRRPRRPAPSTFFWLACQPNCHSDGSCTMSATAQLTGARGAAR